jgi:hypothetical protein
VLFLPFKDRLPHRKIVLPHHNLAPQNVLVWEGTAVAIPDCELVTYYLECLEYAGGGRLLGQRRELRKECWILLPRNWGACCC